MSEVAILLCDAPAVVADVEANSAPGFVRTPAALPALLRLGRFGQRAPIESWRAWLAGWLGRRDLAPLAGASPAVIAAAADVVVADQAGRVDGARQSSVWLAMPVHLTAGLRSVHLPPDGLLRLEGETALELTRRFNTDFEALGFSMRPVPGGCFLAQGPGFESVPLTVEPVRLLGRDLSGSTPRGPGAAVLLRLGAELEMWLHEHPLNSARARLGQPSISTLWLWGGGAVQSLTIDAAAADGVVLGEDACAAGLCALSGARYQNGMPDARAVLEAAGRHARVAVVVPLFAPVFDFRQARSQALIPVPERLRSLDETVLAPVLAALGKGEVDRVSLVAGGGVTTLKARDGLKFWRRSRGPWAVLQ